jgi:hypothetical protein
MKNVGHISQVTAIGIYGDRRRGFLRDGNGMIESYGTWERGPSKMVELQQK